MNDQERAAASFGAESLDQALIALGSRPIATNPDFRWDDPVGGFIPNVILEKEKAAPLRFLFGRVFEIRVGPFSEVVAIDVSEETQPIIRTRIEHALRSTVECLSTKRWAKLTMKLPNSEAWLTLKVLGSDRTYIPLEPSYEPYVRGTV